MFPLPCLVLSLTNSTSCISVAAMTGAAISIDDAVAADTILSVKQRVFAANRQLFVRRQRLVYRAGPRGMDALADDETLGGAGVAQDGSAKFDVLLADLTPEGAAALGAKVWWLVARVDWILWQIVMCDSMFEPILFRGTFHNDVNRCWRPRKMVVPTSCSRC